MITNFMGSDPFIFWKGVVEETNDPYMIGRCKVRIFGYHTQDKALQPTDALPWAYPMLPLDNGTNVIGPKLGDWIIGFFRDSTVGQEPIMMGVIPGIPEDPANPELGFYDPTPDGLLTCEILPRTFPQCIPATNIPTPKSIAGDCCSAPEPVLDEVPEVDEVTRYPLEDRLTEPSSSRLARNENIAETIVLRKLEDLGTAKIADHKNSGVGTDVRYITFPYIEPPTPYAAKYPYNHVYQSEGGHFIEYDDTPQAERLHWYHKSGGFTEVHPNATEVNKVKRQQYNFILHDYFLATYKTANLTSVEAFRIQAGQEMNLHSCGDMNRDTESNLNTIVRQDSNKRVQLDDNRVVDIDSNTKIKNFRNTAVLNHVNNHFYANVHTRIDANENKQIFIDLNEIIGVNASLLIGNDGTLVVGGDLRIAVVGDLKVGVSGNIVLDASQDFVVNAQNILLNAEQKAHMSGPLCAQVESELFVTLEAPLIFMDGETFGPIHAEDALVAAALGAVVPPVPPIPCPPIVDQGAPHFYVVTAPLIEPEDPEKSGPDPSCV